jgi:hypothetical protein
VVSGSVNALIATIPITVGQFSYPAGVAVDPATHQIYVSLFGSAAVAVTDGTTASLVGDPNVASNVDSLAAGQAEAFPYDATATGSVDHRGVYLDPTNQSTQVAIGLYTNTSGNQPGSALAGSSAIAPSPPAGKWAVVARKKPFTVHAGVTYGIAILSTSGALHFRDTAGGARGQLLPLRSARPASALFGTWSSGFAVRATWRPAAPATRPLLRGSLPIDGASMSGAAAVGAAPPTASSPTTGTEVLARSRSCQPTTGRNAILIGTRFR